MCTNRLHSVTLDEDLCRGCTTCISNCPTEAIRVRNGKAHIISERCIDCGECIRSCPSHAKKAISDPLSIIDSFDYKVAIPAPSFYGQFKDEIGTDRVLSALLEIGFDDIYEVARAAEIVSMATRRQIDSGEYPKPMISSSCPAVVKLIQVRFPGLIEHVIKIQSPMEVAARVVKNYIHKDRKNVGVFFISPCPAKVSVVKTPLGHARSFVDGIIAVKDIYPLVRTAAKSIKKITRTTNASGVGIGWAHSDGESEAVNAKRSISVDGIHQVIDVLEQIENADIHDIDFIEAMACPGGCVGGTLNVENPYIARSRVKRIVRNNSNRQMNADIFDRPGFDVSWTKEIYSRPALKLDEDIKVAMKMMEEIDRITEELPGLDCGSCGAPSCRALAEDIVKGFAEKNDCIFLLKDEIKEVALQMALLEKRMPSAVIRDKEDKDS